MYVCACLLLTCDCIRTFVCTYVLSNANTNIKCMFVCAVFIRTYVCVDGALVYIHNLCNCAYISCLHLYVYVRTYVHVSSTGFE